MERTSNTFFLETRMKTEKLKDKLVNNETQKTNQQSQSNLKKSTSQLDETRCHSINKNGISRSILVTGTYCPLVLQSPSIYQTCTFWDDLDNLDQCALFRHRTLNVTV